eukprot:snap_masked-scaffold_7-processed-gene-1.42-mRNA-1 protein AED:0.24 eAED:0.24 QI:95/1/1/1/0/1/2/260/145
MVNSDSADSTLSSDSSMIRISPLLDFSNASPPLQLTQKKKRRKRARTETERQQRAMERKIKNRQSAMRSRQRVLNEIKKDKQRIEELELALKAALEDNRVLRKEIDMLQHDAPLSSTLPEEVEQRTGVKEEMAYHETAVFGSFLT